MPASRWKACWLLLSVTAACTASGRGVERGPVDAASTDTQRSSTDVLQKADAPSAGTAGSVGGSGGAAGTNSGPVDAPAERDATVAADTGADAPKLAMDAAGGVDAKPVVVVADAAITAPDAARVRVTPTGRPEVMAAQVPNFDKNTLVLTFDDGPDQNLVTNKVLDVLDAEKLPATFCINSENQGKLAENEGMKNTVRRIVRDGYGLCNHTVRHVDLTTLSTADIEKEFSGVTQLVSSIVPNAVPLTLARTPFLAMNDTVRDVMAKYGVHVHVDLNSEDYNCPGKGASCVSTNVLKAVDAGGYGIVLMHSWVNETAEALPDLIKELRKRGKRFGTVEDVVRAKYGKSSYDLYYPVK